MAYHLARALYTKSQERMMEHEIKPGDFVPIIAQVTPFDWKICDIIRSYVTSIDMIAITSMEHCRFYFCHFHCYSLYIEPLVKWRKKNNRPNPAAFGVWYTGDYEDPNPYNSPLTINGINYSMRKQTLNVVVCHILYVHYCGCVEWVVFCSACIFDSIFCALLFSGCVSCGVGFN